MNRRLALALALAVPACHSSSAPTPAPSVASPSAPAGNTAYVGPATPADAAPPSDLTNQANRSYDRGDYDEARRLALEVLAARPDDIRMQRLVVSAACILGDADQARAYFAKLPMHDQDQMTRRCDRYGITLP
jgi:Tfp pilus assembly protein PilF